MNQVVLVYLLALGLAWPLGRYMAAVYSRDTMLDRAFGWIERPLYRLAGVDPNRPMDWRDYARAILKLHAFLAVGVFALLVFQGHLPLNPDHVRGMRWDLALHTAASFLTNTDQQHYAGQTQLSYLAQMLAIVTLQVVTPATGVAALAAIVRTLLGRAEDRGRTTDGQVSVGNFHADLVRGIVRLLLPLAFGLALVLAWQGVPSTFHGAQTVHTLDPAASLHEQHVPVGPVAPMVSIKQIATNGGGWYGANAATPLSNPTPLTNFLETVAIILLPMACVVMAGYLGRRMRLAGGILVIMMVLSVTLSGLAIGAERQPNPAFAGLAAPGPNLEGKEVRIGATASALWASLTTQTSNGSVNATHDSLNPLGGLAALMGMFVNATFGGVGVGLINFLVFMLLAAFLGSLMIGRSPEFLGRPIETKEIKLISVTLLIQPLLSLGMTAAAFALPGVAHNSNPGFHGVSQVLYEYASAFANNGSGFEGLGDATTWWNLSCTVNLILGRFIPILAPLAIAAHLASKRTAPRGRGSLDVQTPTFGVLALCVIVMFALLSFLPVLVLGPIAEALSP